MLPAEWILLIFGILVISLGTISFILLVAGFDPTTQEQENHLERKPNDNNQHEYLTEAQIERSNRREESKRVSEDVTRGYSQDQLPVVDCNEDARLINLVPLHNTFEDAHSDHSGYELPNREPVYDQPNNRRNSNDSFETIYD